jgi:hypothetical protein
MDVHGFDVCSKPPNSLPVLTDLPYRMLGSLTFYRRLLRDNVFSAPSIVAFTRTSKITSNAVEETAGNSLPTIGHALAGIMAGATVSFIAAPVEHIKARLQVQYAANKKHRLYSGPIGKLSVGIVISLFKEYDPMWVKL